MLHFNGVVFMEKGLIPLPLNNVRVRPQMPCLLTVVMHLTVTTNIGVHSDVALISD